MVLHRADGKFECAECGAMLDLPDGASCHDVRVSYESGSGRWNYQMRVLRVRGLEIHRCDYDRWR